MLKRLSLEQGAAGDPVDGSSRKGAPFLERLPVLAVNEIQPPLASQLIAIADHLGNLVSRVDMDQRERHVAEERLAGEPEQHRAVFPDRPQHSQLREAVVRLTQNMNTPALQLLEMIHPGSC